jgi:hypothetical protein
VHGGNAIGCKQFKFNTKSTSKSTVFALTGLNSHSVAQPLDLHFRIADRDNFGLKVDRLVLGNLHVLERLSEHGRLNDAVVRCRCGRAPVGALQIVDLGHGRLMLSFQVNRFLG